MARSKQQQKKKQQQHVAEKNIDDEDDVSMESGVESDDDSSDSVPVATQATPKGKKANAKGAKTPDAKQNNQQSKKRKSEGGEPQSNKKMAKLQKSDNDNQTATKSKQQEDLKRRVFVSKLSKDVTTDDLKANFTNAIDIRVFDVKAPLNCGHLDFATTEEAVKALESGKGIEIKGSKIITKFARSAKKILPVSQQKPIGQQKQRKQGYKALLDFSGDSEKITKEDLELVLPLAKKIKIFGKDIKRAVAFFVDAETAKKACTGNVEVKGVTVQVKLQEAIQTNNKKAQNKAAANSKATPKKQTAIESMKKRKRSAKVEAMIKKTADKKQRKLAAKLAAAQ